MLAKLKVRTEGKQLWMRTIGSTIVGEACDTLIFYPLAFYGAWSNHLLLRSWSPTTSSRSAGRSSPRR